MENSCFYCVVQLQSKPASNYESNTNKLRHLSRVCVMWKQNRRHFSDLSLQSVIVLTRDYPDSKVHGAHMGPTWVLSAPDGPHDSPMNLAIKVRLVICWYNLPFDVVTYLAHHSSNKSHWTSCWYCWISMTLWCCLPLKIVLPMVPWHCAIFYVVLKEHITVNAYIISYRYILISYSHW